MASDIPLGRAIAALAASETTETQEARERRKRDTLAAYAWLDRQPQGVLILEDLAVRLTKPCLGKYDEGGRRLVLEIFKAIAEGKRLTREEEAHGGS